MGVCSHNCNLREPKTSESLNTCDSGSTISNPCCVGWSKLAWMRLHFVCLVKTSPSLSVGCCLQSLMKHYDKALCKYEVLLKCRVIHWTSLFSIRHIPRDISFLPEHVHSMKCPSGKWGSAKSGKANYYKVNSWVLVCKGGKRLAALSEYGLRMGIKMP